MHAYLHWQCLRSQAAACDHASVPHTLCVHACRADALVSGKLPSTRIMGLVLASKRAGPEADEMQVGTHTYRPQSLYSPRQEGLQAYSALCEDCADCANVHIYVTVDVYVLVHIMECVPLCAHESK